ncbi:ChbG/HpnK family deacetylase [Bacillus licheniformis]|nr:ChbG/HpnK family deacetylase [Bacillus licheniformis]
MLEKSSFHYRNFRKLLYYQGFFDIDLEEVYREWKAQIEKALSCGLNPTHIDSHHHIHTYGNLPEVFVEVAKEYDLPGVNLGIIEAFQHGVLTSTTLMVNMQEADHAVELARQNPELGVGIHLTLTAGRPILGGLHTITDEEA